MIDEILVEDGKYNGKLCTAELIILLPRLLS